MGEEFLIVEYHMLLPVASSKPATFVRLGMAPILSRRRSAGIIRSTYKIMVISYTAKNGNKNYSYISSKLLKIFTSPYNEVDKYLW